MLVPAVVMLSNTDNGLALVEDFLKDDFNAVCSLWFLLNRVQLL